MGLAELDEIIETFQSVDVEMRMQLLLDFAKRLPPLPAKYMAQRDAGLNRVPECQTPVFLFVEKEGGHAHFHVDVAEEAPTVKGFLSILIKAFDGSACEEVQKIPAELLNRLGLSEVVRMTRAVGLAAILARIKREAAAA